MGLGSSKQTGQQMSEEAAAKEKERQERRREDDMKTQAINIMVATVSGASFEVQVLPTDTVRFLKSYLAKPSGIAVYQQRLLLGTAMLQDSSPLSSCGVQDGCTLTLVVGPKVPDFAASLGMDGEHPAYLRNYFAQHSPDTPPPPWMEDDAKCWEEFEKSLAENERRMATLQGWNHKVDLSIDDEPAHLIRASPGQELRVRAEVRIQNNQADGCIQQLILALDATILAELYNGVPGSGRTSRTSFTITAPRSAGVYMLWRKNDLQYSMADARRNFENSVQRPMPDKYPGSFVGWLVVE
mmetsp:Transcript_64667/g.152000  ORF Transcript_64667/g.152000 Transcript_64667/m.152000 type:complete len:298 (-) Transcript_64667:114-1007(-)